MASHTSRDGKRASSRAEKRRWVNLPSPKAVRVRWEERRGENYPDQAVEPTHGTDARTSHLKVETRQYDGARPRPRVIVQAASRIARDEAVNVEANTKHGRQVVALQVGAVSVSDDAARQVAASAKQRFRDHSSGTGHAISFRQLRCDSVLHNAGLATDVRLKAHSHNGKAVGGCSATQLR